jgi:hypothetical protein
MTESIIAIFAALGGLVLIVGSLILLYQGRITLQAIQDKVKEVQQPDALAVEIGKIRIRSQYPTIALFLVAIGCFWLGLEYAKGPKRMVSGTLDDPLAKDYTVTYKGMMGVVFPDDQGHFEQEIPADVDLVILEIAKGGLDPQKFPIYPGKVTAWPVKCQLQQTRTASAASVPKPELNPSQIVQLQRALPPLKTQ